ncbi:MAG: glycerophosphodiester phosphodiesterase family protein [Deltaproteobacteria bacterium]|nr:glycerophosphodiester phosphodiesterase family protein [Deltaproteobacteria bacterium]
MVRVALVGCGMALVVGCDDGEPAKGAPAEPTWPPPPSAFLAPTAYDCSATSPIEPPPRPHDPGCFHDPTCAAPLVASHRIATPFAPENSLSALRAAILLGVDIVETDLRLTADGHVVIIHDDTVDRTLEGSGEVEQLTLDELRALPMRVPATLPAGDFSCDRVPVLGELLDLAEGRIIVELEVKDSEAGVLAAEHLRDGGLWDGAFLLCDPSECAAIRAAVPDAPIMTRPESADEVAAALSYTPPPIMVHIDPFSDFLNEPVVEAIHSVGAKVYANAFLMADVQALTAGRFEAYVEMYDAGLDVVQTEFPHWALTGLGRQAPAQ